MKTFRYPLGHIHYKALTVEELIERLSAYPKDMPVLAEWEGVCTGSEDWTFYTEINFNGGMTEDACDVLILDVE